MWFCQFLFACSFKRKNIYFIQYIFLDNNFCISRNIVATERFLFMSKKLCFYRLNEKINIDLPKKYDAEHQKIHKLNEVKKEMHRDNIHLHAALNKFFLKAKQNGTVMNQFGK